MEPSDALCFTGGNYADFSWFYMLDKTYTFQTKFLIVDEIIEINFALKNYQRPFDDGSKGNGISVMEKCNVNFKS